MRFEHETFPHEGIVDARPLGDGWAVLKRDGTLGPVRLDVEGLKEPLELHVSSDGRFAAVVERFGQFGRAFDLRDGRTSMALDRGEYLPEYSAFPLAFFSRREQTLLVHGTDWNRLDVSDAATGELLTQRGPTVCTDAKDVPPHYLDYFHAGLAISPDGRWIAEDGWHWHPLGELRVWSLDDWVARNVWESEDGASIRAVTQRGYLWDTPMTWIDGTRLAFWGEGDDAEAMRDAVRVYDVVEGREVGKVEGVRVAPAMPWPPGSERAGWMVFDDRLFAVSPSEGTGVWSLGGERLCFEAGFAPRRYHACRKEFLSWGEGAARVSRFVAG